MFFTHRIYRNNYKDRRCHPFISLSTRNDEASIEIKEKSTRKDEAILEIKEKSTRKDKPTIEIKEKSTRNDQAILEIKEKSTRNDQATKESNEKSTRNDQATTESKEKSTRNDQAIKEKPTRKDEAIIETKSTKYETVNIEIKKSEVQDKDVGDISTDDHKDIIQLLKSVESIVYPEDSNTYTQYPSNDINVSSMIQTQSFCYSQTPCFIVPILISSYRQMPNSSYHRPIFFHDPVVHSNILTKYSACCDESSLKGQVISSPIHSLSPVESSSLGVHNDSAPGLLAQNLSALDHVDSGARHQLVWITTLTMTRFQSLGLCL